MMRIRFTRDQIRFGVIGGAVLFSTGVVGTTAALATGFGQASHAQAEVSRTDGRVLSIRFSAPQPLIMPAPPGDGDRLAVLAAPPADLAADPDLSSAQSLALMRQTDAVQAHDAQVQAALWDAEQAHMQAQMDTATKASFTTAPETMATAPRSSDDADTTAAAGDTRKAPPSAD